MDFINEYWPYVAALLPTLGVAFLFYWIIRYMIEADRSERKALAKWNADHKKADSENASGDNSGDSASS
ncbi:DUF2730 domain-containing protein [Janibacter limosus]|jgi:hypothetical protein|uniref:DUF2730 domain-containing protein n=1 Tax=Janibacter limosus TaxID=53458 RepID=A0AC61U2Y6_9MICO|nr:DUF2730 domain-containing protein [Janibacter limosus]UUZ44208.1 DUF2730 domain-containing protein [Janibacter limosus]